MDTFQKWQRILLLYLSACILFVFLSASVLTAIHTEHDCIGDRCAVCEELHYASVITKQLLSTAQENIVLLLLPELSEQQDGAVVMLVFVRTLINDKVRINC